MNENLGETSMNLWSLAKEFHDAARALMKENSGTLIGLASTPTFYLLSHGIELVLKAYLRSTGGHAPYLKRLGHDLGRCLEQANQAGLSHHVQLDEKEQALMVLVNTYYHAKELEYVVTQGLKRLPNVQELACVFEKLLRGTRQVCFKATAQERRDGAVSRPSQ